MKTAKIMNKSNKVRPFQQFSKDFQEDFPKQEENMVRPKSIIKYTRMNQEIFDNYGDYI